MSHQTDQRTDSSVEQSVPAIIRDWWRQLELPPLLLLGLVFAGIWLFAALAEAALAETPHRFDTTILLAMRDPANLSDPLGPDWFEEWVRDITALGGAGILLVMTIIIFGYLLLHRNFPDAWVLLATIVGGFFLTLILKEGYGRPRPDLVPLATHVMTASFPSGHASTAAVTYLTLGALLARLQPRLRLKVYVLAVAVLLTVAVGLSRIYLGVHWPTDVLGGWTIGVVWATASWLGVRWWQRRRRQRVAVVGGMAPAAVDRRAEP